LEIAMLYLSLLAIGILFPLLQRMLCLLLKKGGTAAALFGFMQLMVTFLMSGFRAFGS
jgi:DHA1 family bicyclomycin/chloramphenicol resistance-like MFS transporter